MACIVSLDNATTLGWDVSWEYTDNNSEKLKKITTISVELLAVDLDNATAVGDCVTPLTDLRNDRSYPEIIINSYSFGSGQLKSFDLSEGTFVNEGVASLSFEVVGDPAENGGVCWLRGEGGEYYDGLPLDDPLFKPKNLENLSETFSFSSGKDGGGSFSHSIDIQFNSTDGVVADDSIDTATANIATAQALALKIFEANPQPPFGIKALPDILQAPNLSTYYSENLDYVNGGCSFEKTYDAPEQECQGGACSTHSLSYSRSDCVDSVSINGEVKGIWDAPKSKMDYAQSGWQGYFPGASAPSPSEGVESEIRSRLSAMFDRFKDGDAAALNTVDGEIALVNLCTTFDTFEGVISYNADANNDPKQEGDCEIGQSQTLTYNKQDGPPVKEVITVSENVTVQGKGKMRSVSDDGTTYPAYEKAEECYNTLWDGADARLQDLYPEGSWLTPNGESLAKSKGNFKKTSSSVKSSNYQGSKSYTVTYSDDKTLQDEEGCIKESTLNITHAGAKQRYAISTVPQHEPIVEGLGYDKPKRTLAINMKGGTGDCGGGKSAFEFMLESGKSILEENKEDCCYINSINYNYAENKDGRTFSLNAEFTDEIGDC